MSGVTMEEKREAMGLVWDLIAGLAAPSPCEWGCPPDEHHKQRPAPEQTGEYVVYGFYGWTGRCLYVGQTREITGRCYQHWISLHPAHVHTKEVRILATASNRQRARLLEAKQIRALDPPFNILHSPTNRRRTA